MYYKSNLYERQLIQSQIDISQLAVLQRKSLTRLQFFQFQKIKFIKSTEDKFNNLRILLLALLTKIYEQYSELNQSRLNTLKNIIYSASLQKITKDKGLQKQQLHKLIANQFIRLQVGLQAQNMLLNMFNCVSFFDQIMLRSIQQKISPFSQVISIESLQKQFNQLFNVKIVWNREFQENNQQNQMYLWKQKDKILKQSSLNMTFIAESSQQQSNATSNRGSTKKNKKSKSKSKSKTTLLQSISINSSTSPFFESSLNKENELKFEGNNISSFEHKEFSKQKKRINDFDNVQNPQFRLVKSQYSKKKKSFWDILCCSSD